MTDTKAGTPKSRLQRQCVACRQMKDKKDLLRIVRTPEGEIRCDSSGRMNGRGAYLCRSAECLHRAEKSGGLERSLKAKIPKEIYGMLEKETAQ